MNAALEIEAKEGGCCGAIASAVYGMFLFHNYTARLSCNVAGLEVLYNGSRAALQTATRIMVDLAQSREDGYILPNIDYAAPACRYAA